MTNEIKTPEEKTVLQGLIEEAKKEGLDIAEDAAKDAVRFIFKAIPKLASMITNPTIKLIVGVIVPAIAIMEPQVIKFLDKIDGEIDPE